VTIDIDGFVHSISKRMKEVLIQNERGTMESRLLAYENATTLKEIASWTNNLIGKEVPGNPGYKVINVLQFQLISSQSAYDAMILFEVTQENPEMHVALKEADIEVIEELTSTIDEPI
jgi:hypothetical protein